MPQLPTGTVTFLFTDIEGSTRLLQEVGEGLREELGAAAWPETTMKIGDPVELARAAIGEDAVKSGLSEGRDMTVEEAFAYARMDAGA